MSAKAKPKFKFSKYPKRFVDVYRVEHNYSDAYHEGTEDRRPDASDLKFYALLNKSRTRVDGDCASWDPR